MKIKTAFFLWLLFPTVVSATPLKMEMIFLSPQKVSMIIKMLDKYEMMKLSSRNRFAQMDMENCMPMGEGCFHPQYGYIEKKPEAMAAGNLLEDKKLELKTFNATETSLVNCDKNNYFDIFCGKERGDAPQAEFEVWFDVSSSLRTVDYNRDPEQCGRRTFIEKVKQACKGRVRASIYNTSIKEMGEQSSACLGYGTNDQSRLLRWMRDSKAKHLLIVTDVDELSSEMRNFLESNGAKMTGDGVKAFTANDLVDYAKEFIKMCK